MPSKNFEYLIRRSWWTWYSPPAVRMRMIGLWRHLLLHRNQLGNNLKSGNVYKTHSAKAFKSDMDSISPSSPAGVMGPESLAKTLGCLFFFGISRAQSSVESKEVSSAVPTQPPLILSDVVLRGCTICSGLNVYRLCCPSGAAHANEQASK